MLCNFGSVYTAAAKVRVSYAQIFAELKTQKPTCMLCHFGSTTATKLLVSYPFFAVLKTQNPTCMLCKFGITTTTKVHVSYVKFFAE